MTLSTLFYSAALTVLIGWLLVIGQGVILPIVVAVLLAYVLTGAIEAIGRVPVLARLPMPLRYVLVLTLFGVALGTIGAIAIENLSSMVEDAPNYEERITRFLAEVGTALGAEDAPDWDTLRDMTVERIDPAVFSIGVLSSVASVGGYTVLIATYVVFMLIERGAFWDKVSQILPAGRERDRTQRIFRRINEQIVTYLSTKTLVNTLLAFISWVLMSLLGIDNAVFWAFVIGLFNYIPYVGSLIGVGLVVVYTLLQTGALQLTLLTMILLTAAQVYIGNWLEPRVMSRTLNLSPLVVLVSLVVWASIWGVPGAIIAVPMTSILMIVFAGFDGTRAIPVLFSRDGEI